MSPKLVHIHQHVLSLLCSHYVSQDGRTALMWACWEGHSDAACILITAGAQVDLQDKVRCSICVIQTP